MEPMDRVNVMGGFLWRRHLPKVLKLPAGIGGHKCAALTAAAALACIGTPVSAQINPYAQTAAIGPGDNDDNPLRAPTAVPGLTGYSRGLSIDASIASRYDSNLTRRPIADAGFRVRPQVGIDYGLGLGRGGLFVQGNYGRDFIFGSSAIRPSDRLMLGGGVDFQLSRCTGQTGGSWRRGLTFVTDASQFGGFSQEIATAGFAAQCRVGNALSINGSVLRSDIKSVRDSAGAQSLSGAFDLQRWSYSAGLGFGTQALGQFSLGGSISDSRMPGRLVLTPTGLIEDGLGQRSARFGYSRRFGAKINLSAGLSYIDTQPNTTLSVIVIDGVPQIVDRPGFKGLGYDVALDVNLTPRFGLSATAIRNTMANGFVGAQFTIANSYAAQIDYRLGSRYTVAAGINTRKSEYRGAFTSALDPLRRISDDFTRVYGQFGGRLGRRLRFALDVAYSKRRSDPNLLNFDSTSVGLTIGYQLGRG